MFDWEQLRTDIDRALSQYIHESGRLPQEVSIFELIIYINGKSMEQLRMTPVLEQLLADIKEQEDGRGGHTYESRGSGIAKPKLTRVKPYKCRWCGRPSEFESYHPWCRVIKQRAARG